MRQGFSRVVVFAAMLALVWASPLRGFPVWALPASALLVFASTYEFIAAPRRGRNPVAGAYAEGPSVVERSMPDAPTSSNGDLATRLLQSLQNEGAVGVTLWSLRDPRGPAREILASGLLRSSLSDADLMSFIQDGPGAATGPRLAHVSTVHDGSVPQEHWRYSKHISTDAGDGIVSIDLLSSHPGTPSIKDRLWEYDAEFLALFRHAELAAREESARRLLEAATRLSDIRGVDDVPATGLDIAMTLFGAQTGSIMLADADGILRIHAAVGLTDEIRNDTAVWPGVGIAGWVVSSRKAMLVEDSEDQGRATSSTSMSLPLSDGESVFGALNLRSHPAPERFTVSDLADAETFAGLLGSSLSTARSLDATQNVMFDSMMALAVAMETKDPYTRGGAERLINDVRRVNTALGLDEGEAHAIELAALLHDIGMEAAGGTPRSGRGGLTTVDQGIVQMHPVVSRQMLRDAPSLSAVAPIVYHHHEHFDGGGYVDGLIGEDIPLGARVLAVCDAYVAMTSPRPHRGAMSSARALQELRENAGTQFDPRIVETFVDSMRSESNRVPESEQ